MATESETGMDTVRLGKTGFRVTRLSFGALPIQRVPLEEAVPILLRAVEAGINFFDTARSYTDSEEKIGHLLDEIDRSSVCIATKTGARDRAGALVHLEESLDALHTDHIDLWQLHNPRTLPDPDDPESSYAALLEARECGLATAIGITSHSYETARAAVESGLYDTLQYPLSAISDEKDLSLVDLCRERDVGFIAMKGLCGGLLTDIPAAFAFLRQFENVVPIWGIQRREEMEDFLALDAAPPPLDQEMQKAIEAMRRELAGRFCRGCGYCLPCPANIDIPMAARMWFLLRRAPWRHFVTPAWREKMARIHDCTQCRACAGRCPYGLDTPALLREMLQDYEEFVRPLPEDAHDRQE